jgi:hypothetical protein
LIAPKLEAAGSQSRPPGILFRVNKILGRSASQLSRAPRGGTLMNVSDIGPWQSVLD